MIKIIVLIAALACCAAPAAAERTVYSLDFNWKFLLNPDVCINGSNATFPKDLSNMQCNGLSQQPAATANDCAATCCASDACQVWQFCPGGDAGCGALSCWTGRVNQCSPVKGWQSHARDSVPPPPSNCDVEYCQPSFDDSHWRVIDVPHDFVVEGSFSRAADQAHGYLPFGVGWYRKHIDLPAHDADAVYELTLDGVQSLSTVWLNGRTLGQHASGYTSQTYVIAPELLQARNNVLVVKADATQPDSWWYDGGGIYRHVTLAIVTTPGPFFPVNALYVPAVVSGQISWSSGVPVAAADFLFQATVANSADTSFDVAVLFELFDPSGKSMGTSPSSVVTVAPNSTASLIADTVTLPQASLWHPQDSNGDTVPSPALYTASARLSFSSDDQVWTEVDFRSIELGVRQLHWDAKTGLYVNDVPVKIKGVANHQDFAGVGVAVPDKLQVYRVRKMQSMGVNGWRTAHNMPTKALLHATDAQGMMVWDENHRNGQDGEGHALVMRDRNHASIIIWSICNEVLCNTDDWITDALRMKSIFKSADRYGSRAVSANQNGWVQKLVGPKTPLDVQGFDYSTDKYDEWHLQAPDVPSISSETSSAVSDRGEYANLPDQGLVSGYDLNAPPWGQTAQQAWGGVGVAHGQGILTRPFISGGWTWTGFDYKGEPTPDSWPDINSHFGIMDIAGFPKDRFYWYKSWFMPNTAAYQHVLHLFPHWNWNPSMNASVQVWAYSNANEIELFLNGASQGRVVNPPFAHSQWTVNYAPGELRAVAYDQAGTVVANASVLTASAAQRLVLRISPSTDAALVNNCGDVALVEVAVVDAAGTTHPMAAHNITFSVSANSILLGTGNGDPTCHVNDKSATRPAFHGLALAIVQAVNDGDVTVTAESEGLQGASLVIPQVQAPGNSSAPYWCSHWRLPRL